MWVCVRVLVRKIGKEVVVAKAVISPHLFPMSVAGGHDPIKNNRRSWWLLGDKCGRDDESKNIKSLKARIGAAWDVAVAPASRWAACRSSAARELEVRVAVKNIDTPVAGSSRHLLAVAARPRRRWVPSRIDASLRDRREA